MVCRGGFFLKFSTGSAGPHNGVMGGTRRHFGYFVLCGAADATVYHRWSNDAGLSWSAASDVTSGSGIFAIQPSIAVHNGRAHVIWNDQAEIFYAAAQ